MVVTYIILHLTGTFVVKQYRSHFFALHPQTGVMFCFEPIEIKAFGEEIIWHENENHVHMDVPDTFETQFGTFINVKREKRTRSS